MIVVLVDVGTFDFFNIDILSASLFSYDVGYFTILQVGNAGRVVASARVLVLLPVERLDGLDKLDKLVDCGGFSHAADSASTKRFSALDLGLSRSLGLVVISLAGSCLVGFSRSLI